MEIAGISPLIATNIGVQRLEALMQSKQKKSGESRKSKLDRPESSTRSREIAQLAELIQSMPDVREEKVRQARAKLKSGTYRVKAERIAEKIMEDNLLDKII